MSVPTKFLQTLTTRLKHPAIIPISSIRSGNNKPKSLQKTKRMFKPNLGRFTWSVNVLGGVQTDMSVPLPKMQGVKMQIRRIRDVEKAGGLEGLLLSRRSKDLTHYGAGLRAQLFAELHRLKQEIEEGESTAKAIHAQEAADSLLSEKAAEEHPLLERI